MKPGLKPINPASSAWLDWIRGLAAVAVFTGHVRCFSLENFSSQTGQVGMAMRGFYFLTSLGPLAVIVFFVLSGYLVGGSVLNEFLETGGIRMKKYCVARVARIHSVLVPALLVGLVADWIGLHVVQAHAVYERHFSQELCWNVGDHLNVGTFLGNVACLQTIFKPVFGSNVPLWSLANEFWYYFLFPALLLAVWPGTLWRRRAIAVAAVAGLLWMLGTRKDIYFLFWLAGVGVRLAPELRFFPGWLGFAIFAMTLIFARMPTSVNVVEVDATVAAGFSIWLWSLTQRPLPPPAWLAKPGQQMASSSYTLYACHYPLAVLTLAVFMKTFSFPMPGPAHELLSWLIYGGSLLLIGGLCFGISLLTERKHHELKQWLSKVFTFPKTEG